ncbi:MAG TPA: universal stress protein [Gaiellaceae bacterium]|nr:universal stress protein [Gaiellaceae bacterium]
MPRALVLGYDDSPSAQAALTTAIELALRFGDRLVIAFAYAPPQRLVGEEFAEHRRALAEIGERVTATALDRARSEGVEAEVALVPERAADALVSLAAKHDARLIVVGTYGESPLKSAILGSTPHRLLHLSQIPVLVVPATA